MDDRKETMDKINNTLDSIGDSLHVMDKTLQRNTDSLEEHMRRTNILESQVELVTNHVTKVEFMFKALKWIGAPGAIVAGIVYLVVAIKG